MDAEDERAGNVIDADCSGDQVQQEMKMPVLQFLLMLRGVKSFADVRKAIPRHPPEHVLFPVVRGDAPATQTPAIALVSQRCRVVSCR